MELKNTVELMLSENYKDRMKAEYYQLENRYFGLKRMLKAWDDGELGFTPKCPKSLLEMQLRSMKDLMAILETRAAIEEIDL